MDERESPDLSLRATFRGARLEGSHSNHIVSPKGKLASYLTPCLNRSARARKNPKLAPTGEPDLAPRIDETLRQLCLHIVRERERKLPATNFRHAKSEEKGFECTTPRERARAAT